MSAADGGPPPASLQYKLDKRTLGIIHLNAITRIYGDHGLEVSPALEHNTLPLGPACAVSVLRIWASHAQVVAGMNHHRIVTLRRVVCLD